MAVVLCLNSFQCSEICDKLETALPIDKDALFPRWSVSSLGRLTGRWYPYWTFYRSPTQIAKDTRVIRFDFDTESDLMLFKMLMM